MLYLPAGWFHEVQSLSSTSGGGGEGSSSMHMAFNYWLYPPSTADFERPYGEHQAEVEWLLYKDSCRTVSAEGPAGCRGAVSIN